MGSDLSLCYRLHLNNKKLWLLWTLFGQLPTIQSCWKSTRRRWPRWSLLLLCCALTFSMTWHRLAILSKFVLICKRISRILSKEQRNKKENCVFLLRLASRKDDLNSTIDSKMCREHQKQVRNGWNDSRGLFRWFKLAIDTRLKLHLRINWIVPLIQRNGPSEKKFPSISFSQNCALTIIWDWNACKLAVWTKAIQKKTSSSQKLNLEKQQWNFIAELWKIFLCLVFFLHIGQAWRLLQTLCLWAHLPEIWECFRPPEKRLSLERKPHLWWNTPKWSSCRRERP